MEEQSKELENELAFMEAMRVYRRAREGGDPEEIRKAEEAWRNQVRQEMIQNESCDA